MVAGSTHYELLGVRADATVEEIRRAFRARAKQAHPDAGGDPDTFRRLREAHDTLSDPDRRAEYDRTLGLRTRPTTPGTADAGWTGRQGGFTGDVEFPDWLRDVVDAAWSGGGPGGAEGTGASGPGTADAAVADPEIRWWWPHGADRTPVVVGESVLAVAGATVALVEARTGQERWRVDLPARVRGRPAAAGDLVVVACADGAVHGLDADGGRPRWRLRLKEPPTGAVTAGGIVAVGAGRRLVGLDAGRGRATWTARLTGDARHLLAAGELVVVSTSAGTDAVDTGRGRHRWTQRVAPLGTIEPVWAAGAVWVVHGGQVVRVDPATGAVGPSVAVGLAVIGIGGDDERLHVSATGPTALASLDGYGRLRATTALPAASLAPAVVGDVVVAIGTDGRLRRVDPHGAGVLGEGPLPVAVADDPVALPGGVLVRDDGGALYALTLGGPGA